MTDIIYHHEHWQPTDLRTFLFGFWVKQGRRGPLPSMPRTSATQDADGNVLPAPKLAKVAARVNHGRWLADCPTAGCGGALVVSQQEPLFLCPNCWNAANGGQWYAVVFPSAATKRSIERELLKRPAANGFQAASRNWEPGEAVTALRAENTRMGVGG